MSPLSFIEPEEGNNEYSEPLTDEEKGKIVDFYKNNPSFLFDDQYSSYDPRVKVLVDSLRLDLIAQQDNNTNPDTQGNLQTISFDDEAVTENVDYQDEMDAKAHSALVQTKMNMGKLESRIFGLYKGFEDGVPLKASEIAEMLNIPVIYVNGILGQAIGKEKIVIDMMRNPNMTNVKALNFFDQPIQPLTAQEILEEINDLGVNGESPFDEQPEI